MPEEKRTELGSLGEFELINRLVEGFETVNESTVKSIGDDAAVIEYKEGQIVVSTDLLIENIHFDLMYTPLKHLGYKAVVVNLSDIYAMNAIPEQITVSIGVSNRFSLESLDELYDGIKAACKHYKVDLVGGAYEKLKEVTRGKTVIAADLHAMIDTLTIPDGEKQRLLAANIFKE